MDGDVHPALLKASITWFEMPVSDSPGPWPPSPIAAKGSRQDQYEDRAGTLVMIPDACCKESEMMW